MDEQVMEVSAVVDEVALEFLGRWNRLVSTTNWEKGRIICLWRERLTAAGAPASAATDEAWARQVGNVTPQHVGRLRRVYQRFNDVTEQYRGLFWSHFQAALEWPDAEMYLEGAKRNGWSVAQMRQQRWEAMGAPPSEDPANEASAAEFDEDDAAEVAQGDSTPGVIEPSTAEVVDPLSAAVPFDAGEYAVEEHDAEAAPFDAEPAETVRPFANIAALPPDLNDVVEQFKLAILRHKGMNWQEVDCRHVLAALDALKQLVITPA